MADKLDSKEVITNSRAKLNEAKFFLQEMEDNHTKQPDFTYYFSAFISSARSVLWIMQNEYREIPEWRAWYKSQTVSSNDEAFLKAINRIRVRSEKQIPLQTTTSILLGINNELLDGELKPFLDKCNKVRIVVSTVPKGTNVETIIDSTRLEFEAKIGEIKAVVEDFPDEDALLICKRYCQWLDSVVSQCDEFFADRVGRKKRKSNLQVAWGYLKPKNAN